MTTLDPQRRAGLLVSKLMALSGAAAPTTPPDFGAGAALVDGGIAWVLLEPCAGNGLGAALAWALRRNAASLRVLAEAGTGPLARRALGFTTPIEVLQVHGGSLRQAVVEPLPVAGEVPTEHLTFVEVIRAAGAEPIVEHGVLVGEVQGLEVCRVVAVPPDEQRDGPNTGSVRLEVGVGAHDRETFQMLHGGRPTVEALADVVQSVVHHRQPGARRHPLNLLAQERLLRARLVAEPSLIGALSVAPAAPPLPRPNVKDPVPCVALAELDGVATTVVCSVGVDLELVPYTVDACTAHGTDRAVVVVPARDALDVQHRLARLARPTISVVAVDPVA